MRVLHVVQGYTPAIGGTELLIQRVSEKLVARHGDEVTVYTTTAARNCDMFVNPFAPRIKPGVETINGVTVRRFPVFRLFGAPLWFLSRVCHTLRLPYNDRVRAAFIGPIIWHMVREIARFPADVVAASSFPMLHMYYVMAARRRTGIPAVLHGGLHPEEPWAFDHEIIYKAIQEVDAYICNTTYERDYLLGRGIDGGKMVPIGVGVEPTQFAGANGQQVRERYGWGEDPVVAFIGQQASHKGIGTLILAMPRVWAEFPGVRLLIAGSETRFSPTVRKLIAALPPEQRSQVTVIDNFAEEDKAHLFDSCDVFAYPSSFESFGIAYLEAWIRAKPVIGCRAGAVPSVIDEGQDGLLVHDKDENDLAEAVLNLLRNPQMRREMGARGQRKTLQRYTWDIVADRFREVYVRAIEERPLHE